MGRKSGAEPLEMDGLLLASCEIICLILDRLLELGIFNTVGKEWKGGGDDSSLQRPKRLSLRQSRLVLHCPKAGVSNSWPVGQMLATPTASFAKGEKSRYIT